MISQPKTPAEVVLADEQQARVAAIKAVAARAPYSYEQLKAASKAGTIAQLLGTLDAHTLRAQAVRYCNESPLAANVDEVERRFCRLVGREPLRRAA